MIKYHLKVAWRYLRGNKLFSFLNIIGLATGMACALYIFLWVSHEMSIDKFHKNFEDLYFVEILLEGSDNSIVTPAPLASSLLGEFSGIKNATRFSYFGDGRLASFKDKNFKEKGIEVDTSFFNMFSFQFKHGNISRPFPSLESIIITEKFAEKFFDEKNPLGQIITLDNEKKYTITGVLENIPDNSSIQFDFAIPFKPYTAGSNDHNVWGAWFCATIIQLDSQTSGETLTNKTNGFNDFYQKINKPRWKSQLIPMADVYFKENMQPFLPETGNFKHIHIFSIAGILIFLVTCLNFISLSTSQFIRRFKQVNVRKILGAGYKNMAAQYFTEASIVGLCSLFTALMMMISFQPLFNKISGKELLIWDHRSIFMLILGVFLISLISCFFPLYFFKNKPVTSLQNFQALKPGGLSLRKTLVITQFIISGCLITCTLILQKQLHFINTKEIGYKKENLVSIHLPEQMTEKSYVIKNELLRHPFISSVSTSTFEYIYFEAKISEWEGKTDDEPLTVRPMTAEPDFLKTFAIEIKEGRFYNPEINDSTSLVINKTAAQKMGLETPIGKKVKLPWEQEKRSIIGVVNDFNYWGLSKEIEPLFIFKGNSGNLYARIEKANKQQTLAYIQNVMNDINPSFPFEYSFLDDRYNFIHASQHHTGTVFKVFAGVSILLSCLSLFAMATFTAERRTKEIGIRKINGASMVEIIELLSKEFLILIAISFTFAALIAYFIMNRWLENFAYRIDLSWWMFLLAGLITLIITLLTISYQSIKAASANPVDSLRCE